MARFLPFVTGVLLVMLVSAELRGTCKKMPRVRREWRTLSLEMRHRVARAFWTMKNVSTVDGQAIFGRDFINHDDWTMQHACSVVSPKCDQGHSSPAFMTFHRALLLRLELSLLAIDPKIEALPYWDFSKDTKGGEFYNDPANYAFSDNFFGDYYGDADESFVVTNGLFAYWPVAKYNSDRFGERSLLDQPCTREEWFKPVTATTCRRCCGRNNCTCSSNDVYDTLLRTHDSCTLYTTRNPRSTPSYGGTDDLVYTEYDFDACVNRKTIKTFMDWNYCIELTSLSCIFTKETSDLSKIEGDEELKQLAQDFLNEELTKPCGMVGSYINGEGVEIKVNALHSQAHLRVGLDLQDVSTSPNDSVFSGYHANIDRSLMTWQLATPELELQSWLYPRSQERNTNDIGIIGPNSPYGALVCKGEYHPFSTPWVNGTVLDDVVSDGFPFTNLFGDLAQDPRDNPSPYTHRDILWFTAPSRTPYTYDTLEHYYDSCQMN